MTTTIIISYAILLVCFALVSFWLWKSHKMIRELQDKLKDAKRENLKNVEQTTIDHLKDVIAKRYEIPKDVLFGKPQEMTATEEIQHRYSELILAGTTVIQMCDEKELQKRFSPEELEQQNKMIENSLKPNAIKISDEDKELFESLTNKE